jgi:hypothetical protein
MYQNGYTTYESTYAKAIAGHGFIAPIADGSLCGNCLRRCIEKDYMLLLHGFLKKTQKTPKQEIDLALKRKKGTQA